MAPAIRRPLRPPVPPMSEPLRDRFARPLASLRLSVTDRCNMRRRYCMPEDEYVWLPRPSILTFAELERLRRAVCLCRVALGPRSVGGAPLAVGVGRARATAGWPAWAYRWGWPAS